MFHMVSKLGYKLFHLRQRIVKERHLDDDKADFEYVKDWVRVQIMLYLLREEFNLDEYTNSGIIKDHFIVHDRERLGIIKKYFQKFWLETALIMTPFSDWNSWGPINQVALYYGVNTGYYLAFS